jgi:NAD-dependent DNA ligase
MKDFLDFASKKYYAGEPVISDAEWDKLAEEYNYENVGHSLQHGVPHQFQLYSLKKYYIGEKEPTLTGETVKTPKLDGAAVALLYVNGKYVRALTRGDGKRGEDITEKMRLIVPNEVAGTNKVAQISGEVVAKKTIPNARNYAAGALNLKDIEEFKQRELIFIAYGIEATDLFFKSYTDSMHWIQEDGFNTVIDGEWNEYPQDGVVFRLNSCKDFNAAGYTSSHPRGAYALKTRGEGVRTTLRRVDWQVGRTGAVSPVAILDPVIVGEATVTRATLHNIKYIRELGLEEGCEVEIIRAGEIIPRVVRRVI